MLNTSSITIQQIMEGSMGGFPPSFEGNQFVFMFALFCTLIASLISVTQIYFLLKEKKKLPDFPKSPINIYRYQLILTYFTIFMACGPDAVYLWTYNEISPTATSTLLNIDRIFDSLFLIPFGIFTWLQLKCGPILRYHLLVRATPITIPTDKSLVRVNIIVGMMIFIMSVAVTISK